MSQNTNKMESRHLLDATAEIVSAYLSRNTVGVAAIPELINSVANALRAPDEGGITAAPQPAVPLRKSVAKDHLVCLVCGKKMRTLKRHLGTAHSLTPTAYREMFRLSPDYPITAPDYSDLRSDVARRTGLGQTGRPARSRKKATSEDGATAAASGARSRAA